MPEIWLTELRMTNRFKHIFFDLDHTLWDFDKNAEETLYELYHAYSLKDAGVTCPVTFIQTYTRNNHLLWAEYHLGRITKQHLRENRFKKTFIELGIALDNIPPAFEDDYVRICPTKTNLFPKVDETLSYLYNRYNLHLISNGFKESTELKIAATGLEKYFKTVVISEVIGINKPDRAIFEYATSSAGARVNESLMVGDSIEADIRGAQNFGMEAVYFNPKKKEKPADVKSEINNLEELMLML
jgi:putative hydrolase of the HAD superfamily